MLLCMYGAFITAQAIFDGILNGATLYITTQPHFCRFLQEIFWDSEQVAGFCRAHTAAARMGTFGLVAVQMGLDMVVMVQLYKMFCWAADQEDSRANGKIRSNMIAI